MVIPMGIETAIRTFFARHNWSPLEKGCEFSDPIPALAGPSGCDHVSELALPTARSRGPGCIMLLSNTLVTPRGLADRGRRCRVRPLRASSRLLLRPQLEPNALVDEAKRSWIRWERNCQTAHSME